MEREPVSSVFVRLVVPGVELAVVVMVPYAHCAQTLSAVKSICTPVWASAEMVTLPCFPLTYVAGFPEL